MPPLRDFLDPAASAAIAAGIYQVKAQIDLADGRAWRGTVESEPVEVQVAERPSTLAGADMARQQLLRVRDALIAGDLSRADAAATELLQADFQRPEGFVALALISAAKGDRKLALIAMDLAITRVTPEPDAGPIPQTTSRKSKPVPFEYQDLRRQFELMPSNEP